MKIFITGGTGFIGKATINKIDKTKHQLKLLVRRTSDTSFLNDAKVELIEGELNDRNSLLYGIKDCDSVINIAAHYSFWEPDNSVYTKVNVEGTKNVMECALECGVQKFVHISTAGIYGKPEIEPFTEESKVGPVQFSEYFRTKYEGDKIGWNLFEKKGLPLVMIYPVAVLGAGDPKASGQYIHHLIKKKLPATIFNNKTFSFVYVKDVAHAIVNALEKENNIGQKYIVGNSRYTWREINKMISELSGVTLPKLSLPDFMTMFNAYFLTGVANLIKKPPLWGMAIDQIKVMKAGFNVDGSKAERELGIKYTPIEVPLKEEIDTFIKL